MYMRNVRVSHKLFFITNPQSNTIYLIRQQSQLHFSIGFKVSGCVSLVVRNTKINPSIKFLLSANFKKIYIAEKTKRGQNYVKTFRQSKTEMKTPVLCLCTEYNYPSDLLFMNLCNHML